MAQVGFIGVGNMAGAILGGIFKAKLYRPEELLLYDRAPAKCEIYREKEVLVANSATEVAQSCGIIFLAVKPQNYAEVLQQLAPVANKEAVYVSIAAGISSDYIARQLGFSCKVVRAMPNTPLLLGEGATAMCATSQVCAAEFEQVKAIFETSGIVEVLPEDKMNEVIAVNGSSPAYIYLFAKAMLDTAERYGIDGDKALRLVAQTLIGSAKMLTESGSTPEELIRMVSSPGGTTLKALEALREHGMEDMLRDAMDRCTKRAEELAK